MVKADLQSWQIKISGNIEVVCEEIEKLLRVFRGEFGEELCEIVVRASKISETEFKQIDELDGKGGRK